MWEESYGGGGFDTSAQFHTPGGGEQPQKQPARAHVFIPVTVRQVLESTEEGLKIGPTEVQKPIVKLIGIIKSVEVTSVKILYTLEDNTGSVNCIYYLEEEDSEETVPVVENTYCAVVGSIRTQGGGKHVMVFDIRPITDINEITAHMLEVIYISLKSEQNMDENAQPSIKQQMASSYGDQNEKITNNFGLNTVQQRVYKAITQCPDVGGATVEYIASVLTTKIPKQEIMKIIEFLVNEGHAYSSMDDFHFKSTENAVFDN